MGERAVERWSRVGPRRPHPESEVPHERQLLHLFFGPRRDHDELHLRAVRLHAVPVRVRPGRGGPRAGGRLLRLRTLHLLALRLLQPGRVHLLRLLSGARGGGPARASFEPRAGSPSNTLPKSPPKERS